MSVGEVTMEYVTEVTADGSFKQEFSLDTILGRKNRGQRIMRTRRHPPLSMAN